VDDARLRPRRSQPAAGGAPEPDRQRPEQPGGRRRHAGRPAELADAGHRPARRLRDEPEQRQFIAGRPDRNAADE